MRLPDGSLPWTARDAAGNRVRWPALSWAPDLLAFAGATIVLIAVFGVPNRERTLARASIFKLVGPTLQLLDHGRKLPTRLGFGCPLQPGAQACYLLTKIRHASCPLPHPGQPTFAIS